MKNLYFIMNFGSTSTKVAVYENEQEILSESISHDPNDLKAFREIDSQQEFRTKAIMDFLKVHGYDIDDFNAIVTRGGCCKPVHGGIYMVNEDMLSDIKSGSWGVHPANLGCIVAYSLGEKYKKPVLTANPPTTDEFSKLARYSGIKEIERMSSFQALNHKAIANRYAQTINRNYEDLNLIVVHMGGGISVVAHEKGKMIDGNNALDGDGPFAPERAGSLPVGDVIRMCFSGQYTQAEMQKKITGGGGLMSYLESSDCLGIEKEIGGGNDHAMEVYQAMAYQLSKEIGAASTVLCGKIDAIIFTASLAYSELFTNLVRNRIDWIAPVVMIPGENEMRSLAENAHAYFSGKEKLQRY